MPYLSLLDQQKLLPIERRIEEQILTLVFKVRNGLCPSYLADLQHAYVPSRTSGSSDTPTLTVENFQLKRMAIDNSAL